MSDSMRAAPLAKAGFDAVVMLTWSDWHTEPRGNRFHYATRLSVELPVLFVQPDDRGESVGVERVHGHEIDIVHAPARYDGEQSRAIERLLADRNIRAPLIWTYNPYFVEFMARAPSLLRVYHATEDYFTPSDGIPGASRHEAQVRRALALTDLVVAVSDGVANAYRTRGGYTGRILVLPNGCDAEFWASAGASAFVAPPGRRPVALYQGGINGRLDFALLAELAGRLDDWDFAFCGAVSGDPEGWNEFRRLPNVRYHGLLDVAGIAQLARGASVGIIPFRAESVLRQSLPLKAWEYVACGLPVVTTPIDALAGRPDLFHPATSAAEFERAIRAEAGSRDDATRVRARLDAARGESYDRRFIVLRDALRDTVAVQPGPHARLNVLVLFGDRSLARPEVRCILDALANGSRHRVDFLPATGEVPGIDGMHDWPDLAAYDAVVMDDAALLGDGDRPSAGVAEWLKGRAGLKILFCRATGREEAVRGAIEAIGLHAICTSEPLDHVAHAIPHVAVLRVPAIPAVAGDTTGGSAPESFTDAFDRHLEAQCPRGPRATILRAPAFVQFRHEHAFRPFAPTSPLLLDRAHGRRDIQYLAPTWQSRLRDALRTAARRAWRVLPQRLRYAIGPALNRLFGIERH